MNKFKQKIENILKQEPDFVDIETQEINYNKVKDSADRIDEKLISLLIQDKEIKQKFFTKIKDVYVFNIKGFKFFLDENKIDNSYTQYENRIGLATNKGLLKDNSEVVLNWPYKDCILEGGQSTEEGVDNYFEYSEKKEEYEEKQAKRKEIFFNEILAQDEIDRLLDDKALINWKKYTKDGEQEVKEIKRNENGTIKENLIIKGNNLLALHSLKKQFAGKIKLIYIDPPYNTKNDGFKYNDNFSSSTWLTFMKNRLEVAKNLLTEDGSIYVQIDTKESHYLKILMDEIFGRNNFRSQIIWDTSIPYVAGNKWHSNNWIYSQSTIFYYAKQKENVFFNKLTFPVHQPSGDISNKPFKDVWTDIKNFSGFLGAKDLKLEFNTRKPEHLLKRIILASSNPNDIILDFCMGSGTTCAVAHKMKRQYIGIEQMEYIENIALLRLCEVIKGEQKGISKDVDWQGGGDFVYMELAKWNEEAKEKIENCKNLKELEKLFDELYEKYFLNYNVKIKEFKEKIIKEEKFKELSLEKQKKMFLNMLDLNQMYIQKSEMSDKKFGISEKDQKLTEEFYKNI
jgi:adenine-specific DNA-methyltransferase